jgi:fructoselysine-6-P-deglycase FrlB-like protein
LRALGVEPLIAALDGAGEKLTGHPDTDPVCLIQRFYRTLPRIAVLRGADPDHPPYLKKVTRTH